MSLRVEIISIKHREIFPSAPKAFFIVPLVNRYIVLQARLVVPKDLCAPSQELLSHAATMFKYNHRNLQLHQKTPILEISQK